LCCNLWLAELAKRSTRLPSNTFRSSAAMLPSAYYSSSTPAAAASNSTAGHTGTANATANPATHIRRSCVPHSSLLPYVKIIVHRLVRPRVQISKLAPREDENELRVTASVYGFGIPLHSHATATSTLVGWLENDKKSPQRHSLQKGVADDRSRNAQLEGSVNSSSPPTNKTNDVHWEEEIKLPIRWKDTTRDGCIVLNVLGSCGQQVRLNFLEKDNTSDER
jgi:hypothetical protein